MDPSIVLHLLLEKCIYWLPFISGEDSGEGWHPPPQPRRAPHWVSNRDECVFCRGQDYTRKIFRKAGVRARRVLFPTQRSLSRFQPLSHNPRLQIPISQGADGDSTYSETRAGVCNALFYPLPSSCRLCRPDVPVREAEVLRGLPRGKDSEVRT